jgi:hypothetical protein
MDDYKTVKQDLLRNLQTAQKKNLKTVTRFKPLGETKTITVQHKGSTLRHSTVQSSTPQI